MEKEFQVCSLETMQCFPIKNTHWLRFSSLFNQDNAEEKSIIPSLDKNIEKVPQIQNEERKTREKNMKTSKSNI